MAKIKTSKQFEREWAKYLVYEAESDGHWWAYWSVGAVWCLIWTGVACSYNEIGFIAIGGIGALIAMALGVKSEVDAWRVAAAMCRLKGGRE